MIGDRGQVGEDVKFERVLGSLLGYVGILIAGQVGEDLGHIAPQNPSTIQFWSEPLVWAVTELSVHY